MVALIYGLVRSLAVALIKWSEWRHKRAKNKLEKADKEFRKVEQSCKAGEVEVGRHIDYFAQIQLLKLYESREKANSHWKRAATKLASRKLWQKKVTAFSGRKLPYTLGLVDLALAMKLFEFACRYGLNVSTLAAVFG